MSGNLHRHIRSNVWGIAAVFIALSGTAYATHPGGANTVSTEDIINGQVLTQDIGTAEVNNSDIAPNSVPSSKIVDGAVQGADVAGDTLTGAHVADTSSLGGGEIDEAGLYNDNSLDAGDIANNSSLTGSEINESALGIVPNATEVDGNRVRMISAGATNGSGSQHFTGGGGLDIDIACVSATGDLTMTVRTETDNSTFAVSDDDSYNDIEDFDVADGDVDLATLVGADSDEVINLVYREGAGFGTSSHPVVMGQLHILDQAPDGANSECVVAGYLIFQE